MLDIMKWFKVEKVEYPSEEPPAGEPIALPNNWVMEEEDVPYYRLFKYGSIIYIYDMHNYFIARQYAYDERTDTEALHAEYRLTLTDDARKIVDALLSKPFKCEVEKQYDVIVTIYTCTATYMEFVPSLDDSILQRGEWKAEVYVYGNDKVKVEHNISAIPFNCGPLRPLWNKAVECWVKEIAREIMPKYTADIIDNIRHELLEDKYLHAYIIPTYRI